MSNATETQYTTPDWGPLERAHSAAGLPVKECGAWMWMHEGPAGTHNYKHRLTRLYARLAADTPAGECIRQLRSAAEAFYPTAEETAGAEDGYHPDCSACYRGRPHSQLEHEAALRRAWAASRG